VGWSQVIKTFDTQIEPPPNCGTASLPKLNSGVAAGDAVSEPDPVRQSLHLWCCGSSDVATKCEIGALRTFIAL